MTYIYPSDDPSTKILGLGQSDNMKKPLTAERLIEILEAFYIYAPEFRERGDAFEKWVLNYAFIKPLVKNTRNFESYTANIKVTPDAIGTLEEYIIHMPFYKLQLWGSFPTGVFIEIKALKNDIRSSTAQIKMEIEAVRKNAWVPERTWIFPSRKHATVPVLVLVTTDIQIHPQVIEYADQWGVALWHYIVFESPTVEPKMPMLSIGYIKNLNPYIYIDKGLRELGSPLPPVPISLLIPGIGSTMTKVKGH